MSVYYPYGSSCIPSGNLPDYACDTCLTREFGRVRSFAFYKDSSPFTDITSSTEWSTKINARNAIVLWKVKGKYDGMETEELEGYGDSEFDNGSSSHTLVFEDPNAIDNIDFYNELKDTSIYRGVFRTSSKIWDTGTVVNVKVKLIVPDSIKGVVTAEVTVKWASPDIPLPYTTPTSIFNQCYVVAA